MAQPFVLSFDVAGDQQIQRAFSRFAEFAKDIEDPLNQIADDFNKIETRQFESEGVAGGLKWPDLEDSTIAGKPAGLPILVRSGDLKTSLVFYPAVGAIRKIKKTTVEVGTRIPYAIYHQFGTVKMAERKPIQIAEEDKKRWVKIIQSWLVYKERQAISGTGTR